jgi:ubiquitin-protein ligase E3 C
MFGTFTGNSRRPRNVNLSGQTGNPFANTSWSPSVASNATKTVSDAQAEREKRQAERQRLKAAGKIQRTWRGHKTRRLLAESRRAAFDQMYEHASEGQLSSPQRLRMAFSYLLSFFNSARNDDIRRLLAFIRDAEANTSPEFSPIETHETRMRRFTKILVDALERMTSDE